MFVRYFETFCRFLDSFAISLDLDLMYLHFYLVELTLVELVYFSGILRLI